MDAACSIQQCRVHLQGPLAFVSGCYQPLLSRIFVSFCYKKYFFYCSVRWRILITSKRSQKEVEIMRHCIKTVENESKANHPSREKGVTAKYL